MDPITLGILGATAGVNLIGTGISLGVSSKQNNKAIEAAAQLQKDNQEWSEEQAQKQMDFQTSANKAAMDFSHDEAEIQRNWLENMSNSSYQRAVEDLKAAGLNPILAYSQGGASVPSVSSAQGVSSAGSLANFSQSTGKADILKSAASSSMDLAKNFINSAAQVAALALAANLNQSKSNTKPIGFGANWSKSKK